MPALVLMEYFNRQLGLVVQHVCGRTAEDQGLPAVGLRDE